MGRHAISEPSDWVARFADLIPSAGTVLDLACGAGRHSRLFLARGSKVVALDIDTSEVADLAANPMAEVIEADLEDGRPFPLQNRQFGGIVVSRYLYRPLFPALIGALAPGGILIYETFAKGNELFGRPRNPDHLLNPGELLDAVRGHLRVLAYEDLTLDAPRPAAVQRLCARCETAVP